MSFKVGSGAYQSVTANGRRHPHLDRRGHALPRLRERHEPASPATAPTPSATSRPAAATTASAGWSLVVAYQDATQNVHRVSVYDGLGTVDATHTFSTNIAPFFTPESGTVATKTGLLAFEGDAGHRQTEMATFNGNTLTDALNTLEQPHELVDDRRRRVHQRPSTPIVQQHAWARTSTSSTARGCWPTTRARRRWRSPRPRTSSSRRALWLVSDEGPAAITAGPTIGGLHRDGSTLTANPGTWNGTPTITYEYQWQRCDASGNNCVDIPGATGSTYTLGPDDVGSTVRVLVTAVNEAGSSNPAASAPTSTITQLPPSNVTAPGRQRDARGRRDADHHARQLERHRAARLRRPVAALRRGRHGLRRHPRRHGLDLRPGLGADVGGAIVVVVTATNDAGDATVALRRHRRGPPARAGQPHLAEHLRRAASTAAR